MTQQLTTLITQKYTLVFCNPPVGYEFKHKTETIVITNEDGEHHIIARNVDFKQLFPLATVYVGHIGIGAVQDCIEAQLPIIGFPIFGD